MNDATSGQGTGAVPGWVPPAALHYLDHTEAGMSIRAVARREGCHASTILRQIRRFEQRRDDPLIDEALSRLGACHGPLASKHAGRKWAPPAQPPQQPCDEETVMKEARRILRRMAESGAILAVAPQMEKAAVLRELPDGRSTRTAVVDRSVAEAFALKDWITLSRSGKVATYRLSQVGRAALKRMLEEPPRARVPEDGFAEAQSPFAAQHREWGTREVPDEQGQGGRRRMRYNMAESPVVALSRRREKDGSPFLRPELVSAAERLREDFELAQMGPRVTQDWSRFLTAGSRGGFSPGDHMRGSEGARDRVAAALRDLGPGLGDMALRCCCFLEGLEATEKRMGWSARSGKIVLRIALERLKRHYDETYGPGGGLIG